MLGPRQSAFLGLLAMTIAAATPTRAVAQSAVPTGNAAQDSRTDLVAERQRLHAELERVNAEIDGLKRGNRGVRDDYRLRARMADAEALARRLMDVDARLSARGLGPAPVAARPALGPEPKVAPTDGPAELEAKADILTDQARRLESQAQALGHRVAQLRARRELRRRTGQVDADPFSPLETSKRRVTTSFSPTKSGTTYTSERGSFPTSELAGTGAIQPPPPSTDMGPTTPSTGGNEASAPPPPAVPSQPTASTGLPSPVTFDSGSVSARVRDLLDPATLAEIRRLEAPRSTDADLKAMERAIEALRSKSQRLGAQAKTLRERAKNGR